MWISTWRQVLRIQKQVGQVPCFWEVWVTFESQESHLKQKFRRWYKQRSGAWHFWNRRMSSPSVITRSSSPIGRYGMGEGKLEVANQRQGILCDWPGEQIWLSLFAHELEAEEAGRRKKRGQNRVAGHCWSSSDRSGTVAAEVTDWFVRLPATHITISVLFVMYDLSVACLCIYTLRPEHKGIDNLILIVYSSCHIVNI